MPFNIYICILHKTLSQKLLKPPIYPRQISTKLKSTLNITVRYKVNCDTGGKSVFQVLTCTRIVCFLFLVIANHDFCDYQTPLFFIGATEACSYPWPASLLSSIYSDLSMGKVYQELYETAYALCLHLVCSYTAVRYPADLHCTTVGVSSVVHFLDS